MDNVPICPHQVRKLSASYSALKLGSSKEVEKKLMDRMGCSSMSILKKNYISHVPDLLYTCVLPIGTFYPVENS